MYICMYVCEYVWMYSMFESTYLCTTVCINVSIFVCVCMYVCMYRYGEYLCYVGDNEEALECRRLFQVGSNRRIIRRIERNNGYDVGRPNLGLADH